MNPPATPATGRTDRPWKGAAALAACAFVAIYLVAVRTPMGQGIDTAIMVAASAQLENSRWAIALLEVISPGLVAIATVAVVATALALRGTAGAAAALTTVVVVIVGSQVLKTWLTRPHWYDDAANSLPSGHVAAIAGLAVAAVTAVPGIVRPAVALAGGIAVAATGIATVAAQWHRPSDVTASVLLALAVGSFAEHVRHLSSPGSPPRRERDVCGTGIAPAAWRNGPPPAAAPRRGPSRARSRTRPYERAR